MSDPEEQHRPSTSAGGKPGNELPPADEAIDGDLFETTWDDDDGEDGAGGGGRGGRPADGGRSRTVWIVGAAALVVVVLVGALVFAGRTSKKTPATSPTTSGVSTPARSTSGTAKVATTKAKPRAKRHWPTAVAFRPVAFGKVKDGIDKAKPGTAPGVYVWNDFDGWHVWVVRGTGTKKVKGTITSSDTVTRATAVGAPASTVTTSDKLITFDFTSVTAPVVGVDLNPGFRSTALIFVVEGSSSPLDAKLIFTGRAAKPSDKNPFAIQKTTTP